MEGENSYYGGMACEQESGAGVTDRQLDGENMKEKHRHSGASGRAHGDTAAIKPENKGRDTREGQGWSHCRIQGYEQPCGFWKSNPDPSRHKEIDLVQPVPDYRRVRPVSFAHLQEWRAHSQGSCFRPLSFST